VPLFPYIRKNSLSIRKPVHKLTIKTRKKREVVDITDTLESWLVKKYREKPGICNLLVLHTTAALTTADLDPGTDLDMLDAFERWSPNSAIAILTTRPMYPITFCRRLLAPLWPYPLSAAGCCSAPGKESF